MIKLAEVDEQSADFEDEEVWARRELGARVVRLREERGWSRAEVAARLGVSPGRLGNWERGENAPSLKKLVDLRRVLRVSLDELVAGRAPGEGLLSGEGKAEALHHLAALGSLLERANGPSGAMGARPGRDLGGVDDGN
jgi:transcriptional regulator with XRE-family HTH domain